MDPKEMSNLRDKRITAAVNMERPDRIPINMSGLGFFKYIDPKAVLADYFRRPKYIDDLIIQASALPILNEIDSPPMLGFSTEKGLEGLASLYFGKIKLPGRELGEDAIWNIDEQGPMTEEDYDTVIEKGWGYMKEELFKRIGYDPASMPPPDLEYMEELNKKVAALGKATIGLGRLLPIPTFETLSGARKLTNFIKDMRRMPEKVRAVLEIMENDALAMAVESLKPEPRPIYCGIAGTRAGSDFISAQAYEKFYHPFYQKVIGAMAEMNVKAYLHNDSDWGGFLHYFKEFPKASCIWDPDHMTGMEKAKEIIGDYMCIEGDVPPGMLSVGTPEECYNYARKIISIVGDKGFIMSAGCSVPPNAKRENIEAVILATIGK